MPDADYRVSGAGWAVVGEGSTAGYQFLCSSPSPCVLLSPLVCRMLPATGLLGCNLAHLGPGSLLADAAHCKIGSSRAANAAGKVTASVGLISPARPMQTPYTATQTHTHTVVHSQWRVLCSLVRVLNAITASSTQLIPLLLLRLKLALSFSPFLALTLLLFLSLPFSVCTHVHKCKANKHTGTPSHTSHIVRCHGHFTFCAHVGFCLSTPSPSPSPTPTCTPLSSPLSHEHIQ